MTLEWIFFFAMIFFFIFVIVQETVDLRIRFIGASIFVVLIFAGLLGKKYWAIIGDKVVIEVIRGIMAAFFGYLTYLVYQLHKSKESNVSLYVFILRLEKELSGIIKNLESALSDHAERRKLDQYFHSSHGNDLREFFHAASALSDYQSQAPIFDDHGNEVGEKWFYSTHASEKIAQLEFEMLQVQDTGFMEEYDELFDELRKFKKTSIFMVFDNLEVLLNPLIASGELPESLEYFQKALLDFKAKPSGMRSEELHPFCQSLLDTQNPFSTTLIAFRKLLTLEREHNAFAGKNLKKVSVELPLWKDFDSTQLAIFDQDTFIILDDFYSKLSATNIPTKKEESLKSIKDAYEGILISQICPLKVNLAGIIKTTNVLFWSTRAGKIIS